MSGHQLMGSFLGKFIWDFLKIGGVYLSKVRQNKDYSVLVSMLGSPNLSKLPDPLLCILLRGLALQSL